MPTPPPPPIPIRSLICFIVFKIKMLHTVAAQGNMPFDENPDVGYVCLWSLKNSSYPEYVARTQSGAMCLSFHRYHGYALVVGLRDGTLMVFNVSLPTAEPQYASDPVNDKHRACVRQARTERLNFRFKKRPRSFFYVQ